MTTSPTVIIITGLSGTGKTTLGRRLTGELRLPFVHRDTIKERLFDTLGWRDRDWSRQLGKASYSILYDFIEILLTTGTSLITESNFSSELSTPVFLDQLQKYPFHPVQILCVTDGPVLWQRFQQRAESGERHPGHADHSNYAEFQQGLLKGHTEPLPLPGPLYEFNTTIFSEDAYAHLLAWIKIQLTG